MRTSVSIKNEKKYIFRALALIIFNILINLFSSNNIVASILMFLLGFPLVGFTLGILFTIFLKKDNNYLYPSLYITCILLSIMTFIILVGTIMRITESF